MDDFKHFDIRSWVSHGLTRHIAATSSTPQAKRARAPLMAPLFLSAFAVASSVTPVLSVSSTPVHSIVMAESAIARTSASTAVMSGVDLPFPESSPSTTFTAAANSLMDSLAAGTTDIFDQQTLAFARAAAERQVAVLSDSADNWVTRVGNMLGDVAD